MQKIHHSIFINAPVATVWNTMLESTTYKEWTKPFGPDGSFEGSWEEGSDIKFLGTDENGKTGGMFGRIAENRLHQFVSIQHIGIIDEEGNLDTTSEEVKKWAPAFENYTFTEKDSGTEVFVEMDVIEEYLEMFNEMWPKALAKLRELSER